MKVYVDELPKSCVNCDFGYANNFCEIDYELDLRKFDKNQKHPKCPLQSLADYTKQVRKKVLGELMNMLGDRAELIQTAENESTFMFDTYDLTMCVKEILGEEVKQNEK